MNGLEELFEFARECDSAFSRILFRLVYFCPNLLSEEALTVGILYSSHESSGLLRASSLAGAEIVSALYGASTVEQLKYALDALDLGVDAGQFPIDRVKSPTSLLRLGPVSDGRCKDARKFARDMLEMSSSLYKSYDVKAGANSFVNQEELKYNLFSSASRINAFKATSLFQGTKLKLPNKSAIEIPIYGERIFGASVSFVTKMVGDAKVRAEAYIAKFSYARSKLDRQSKLYVLIPMFEQPLNHDHIQESLDELRLVAESNDVSLRYEKTVDELARAVLIDDAA